MDKFTFFMISMVVFVMALLGMTLLWGGGQIRRVRASSR